MERGVKCTNPKCGNIRTIVIKKEQEIDLQRCNFCGSAVVFLRHIPTGEFLQECYKSCFPEEIMLP